jgi:hypothetical protein
MAKKKAGSRKRPASSQRPARPNAGRSSYDNGTSGNQSRRVLQLIREGTALQVEMLGAAARVWSAVVESVADYNRELTNVIVNYTDGDSDANESVRKLVDKGNEHVQALLRVPEEIAKDFPTRVRKRAGRPVD